MTTLLKKAEDYDVRLYAFCIMPDHVHLIVSPSAKIDVIQFVGVFKNLAQREAWHLGVVGTFWLDSFWDEFLQPSALRASVAYVFRNPVEEKLIERWDQYEFSGSNVYSTAELAALLDATPAPPQ